MTHFRLVKTLFCPNAPSSQGPAMEPLPKYWQGPGSFSCDQRLSAENTACVFAYKKHFPYLLEKRSAHTRHSRGPQRPCLSLSLSSSENALAFFLETAPMPEGHRKSRDLKTMTAFGFWPLLFPLCALYLRTLTREQKFEPL